MLLAGAARIEITPGDLSRTYLAGFGINRRAKGVLEPLEAVALVLKDRTQQVALVAVDCIGLSRPFVQRVRERLAGSFKAGAVILCATHTHSGPDTLGLWGPGPLGAFPIASGVDPDYLAELEEKLAQTVTLAQARLEPAVLRVASFEADAAWARNDRPGARFDHACAFSLEGESGRPIATVLNWAAHPETLWEDNPWLSPDYPGHFRAAVRARAGGEALFFSGPLGAMLTPNIPRGQPLADRVAHIEKLGHALARRTLDELAHAAPSRVDSLGHDWGTVTLTNANWQFALMKRLGFVSLDWHEGGVRSELHHLRLGPLELLSVPGEPSPEVGRQLLEQLRGKHRALFALGIDEIGYVLEAEQFADPNYKYERSMSLGAGTAGLLQTAVSSLVRPVHE